MKYLLRTLAGIPVSFVILIPVAGGVVNAVMVLFLSIICTAGISLVVWIPVWLGLGWIVLGIYGMVRSTPEGENPTSMIRTQYDRDVKGVVTYMRNADANGLSSEQITRNLVASGWSSDVVDEAQRQRAHQTRDS